MQESMEASYDPKKYENKLYQFWLDNKFFHADKNSSKKAFTLLMPPPNVTSQLHMGHGSGYTIQDVLIRWKRMCGYNACYLPGTDHAGIATQMMVEKALAAEGITNKQDLGRDAFLEKLWAWKEKYGGLILEQFKQIGFSCDWDRLAFTMDPDLSFAVRKAFVELFNEKLVYRSERLVHWDPVLKTALSDDEIENKELSGSLYHIRYPIENDSGVFITIATTRPETMLGDTAIAVHPEDERFKNFHGKKVIVPIVQRSIPIITDEYVKMDFGTGALKITPAHDPNDFLIGKKHKLPFINIFNEDASLNSECPKEFQGMDRFVARKEIVKSLKKMELLEKEESHRYAVPHSERSKAIIEPKLSMQWYVKMKDLADPAAKAARNDEIKFYPDVWKKTFLYWLDNIQDWCISRQLWWGHRIPVWYCHDCGASFASLEDPKDCSDCGSEKIFQDEDVLDTWFSSWLWPLSPFGWPDNKKATDAGFETFYPSQVLVTAPDIIFLWVARMVMAGLKFTGKIPFKDVYLTATVCDKQGRKFSKTLGNGIDPLDVIQEYGADAVRYTGVSLAPLGGRVRMDRSDFEHGARFVNKIWNAARFVLKYVDSDTKLYDVQTLKLTVDQKWLLAKSKQASEEISLLLDQYRVNEAVERAYHFAWRDFCDWGIECSKETLQSQNIEQKNISLSVLIYAMENMLRVLHPIMPFVTEEIWQHLPSHPNWDRPKSLCIANFPKSSTMYNFPNELDWWDRTQNIISQIRSIRAQAEISPKLELECCILTEDTGFESMILSSEALIKKLAGLNTLKIGRNLAKPPKSLSAVGKSYQLYIPAEAFLDIDKETKRIQGEIERIEKITRGIKAKLDNQDFMARAPEEVRIQTQSQFDNLEGQLGVLKTNLNSLKQ